MFLVLLAAAAVATVPAIENLQRTPEAGPEGAGTAASVGTELGTPDKNHPDKDSSYLDLIAGTGIFMPAKPAPNEGLAFPTTGLFWKAGADSAYGGSTAAIADRLLESMTPGEILGQLFILGWASENAEGPVMDWIRERGLGGIKVFGWNGQNLTRLVRAIGAMQEAALSTRTGIPLFTATDQEGGWVRHIKDTTSVSSGNMSLGADGLLADAYLSGYFIGTELRAIGVNMNFAPTVDVYRNPLAYVIGPRAFSSGPEATAELGTAFFRGQDLTRVISTAKHFPGHGNASEDSHGTLPVIHETLDELLEKDLLPFEILIDRGIPAVLTGHLNFPEITKNTLPASMSEFFKTEILRGRLGFEGLTITDDLMMEGAWEGRPSKPALSDIVLDAIKAGSDLIMLSTIPENSAELWDSLLATWEADEKFRKAVTASARRALTLKLQYLLPDDRVPLIPDPTRIYQAVPAPGARTFFSEQAARGTALISGRNLPVPRGLSTLIVSQDAAFARLARSFFPGSDEFIFDYNPNFRANPATIAALSGLVPDYDVIIFHLLNGNSSQVLSALSRVEGAAAKVSVVSSLSPVYLADNTWVRNAVAVFGMTADAYTAGLEVLLGRIPSPGSNPIPHLFPGGQ